MGREHGKPGDLVQKNLKCDVCGKESSTKQHLIVHMRVHTGERPFKCTVVDCEMAFKQNNRLKSHMMRHTGERPFKCTVGDCETEFRTKSDLNTHIKFKHSDKRPFKCNLPGCKYDAKISSHLRRHMKKHSDDRLFPCPNEGCKFRSKHKSNLTTHVTAVHCKAKTFPCSECDYKATRKSHLKRHMHHRHSTSGENKMCSHSECAEYLICSYDLDCLLSNQDHTSSSKCDQSSGDQTSADANALYDTNKDVYSEPSVVYPNLNYASYSTITAEDFHTSEEENRENVKPNEIQTLPSLPKNSAAARM